MEKWRNCEWRSKHWGRAASKTVRGFPFLNFSVFPFLKSSFLLALLEQLDNFFHRSFREGLPTAFQGLIELAGGFLHLLIRFFRAADQQEMFGVRESLVSILVVKPDAEEADYFLFGFVFGGHRITPRRTTECEARPTHYTGTERAGSMIITMWQA